MAENVLPMPQPTPQPHAQQAQASQQQVRVTIDEHEMKSAYANAFRTNATAEEVLLDFGVNVAAQGENNQPQISFHLSNRVILNYYSAKRLAITLGQIVRQHETQFGELELDAAKRQKK